MDSRLFYFLCTEFHLNGPPSAIIKNHHGISFQTIRIPIVKYLSIVSIRIYSKIPNTQRLEEKPKKQEVLQQPIGSQTHHGSRDRGIDKMTLR